VHNQCSTSVETSAEPNAKPLPEPSFLPGTNGLACAQLIRREQRASNVPLVLLTSIGRRPTSESMGMSVKDSHFVACISKPIKAQQLRDVIVKVCGSKGKGVRVEKNAAF
jgi:CheY-like chemotaxis protein